MPRAQSPPTAHARPSPLTSKPPSKRQQPLSPTLELTSDDILASPPPPHKSSKRVPSQHIKSKPKRVPHISPSDVIEISSDEDDVPPSHESILADLRRQVRRLKQENERHMKNSHAYAQELARSHAELKDAKASKHKSTDGKLILEHSKLEDGLSCEICTTRMYTPYLLPDCGHTFCLPCLRDWFGTAHARFIQANPHWSPNMLNQYVGRIQGLLRPEYLTHPQIQHQLQNLQLPQPEYTCPTCRKRVFNRPVEDYALKSLVRMISNASEEEKAKIPPDEPIMEHRHGHLVVVDPWEGYFPKGRT